MAVLIVVGAACSSDDDGTRPGTPPPAGAWAWVHPLPQGNTLYALDGISPFDQWVVGERGFVGRYRGLDLKLHSYPVQTALRDVYNPAASRVFVVGVGGTALTLVGDVLEPEPTPTTADLNAMWGSSDKNIIAVGDNGTILQRSGGVWTDMNVPGLTEDLHDIWGIGAISDIRAVGDRGAIARCDGSTWVNERRFTASNLYGVWASKPNDWFAVGANGEIWQDRGAGWIPMASPTTDDLFAIFGNDSAFVFTMGATDSVFFYDHVRWSSCTSTVVCISNPVPSLHAGWGTLCGAAPSPGASAVHCPPDYFVGAGGFLGDYGTELLPITSARTFARLNGVATSGPNQIVAVGDGGTVLRYDGTTVTRANGTVPGDLNAVWVAGANDMFAVGDGGRVLRSSDGLNWNIVGSGIGDDLYDVWGMDANRVWVVGDQGRIRFFDGNTWGDRDFGPTHFRGVWGVAADDVFVVGEGGMTVRVTVASTALIPGPVAADLYAVRGTGGTRVYAVGASGTILHFNGFDWDPVPSPTSVDILDIGTDGRGVLVAAVADGSVLRLEGGTWTRETTVSANGLAGIVGVGGVLFAVGETGTIISYGP